MTTFILFLIISALFWGVLIYKTWQLDDNQKTEISARIDTFKQQSAERLQSIGGSDPVDPELATRFRAWSSDAAYVSEELYQWMRSLNDDHFLVITEFVAQFCDDMGFDLRGVIEGHYADRDLDDTLEQVVAHTTESMRLIFGVRETLLDYEAAQPNQPEIAGQLQQMMTNGLSSFNEILNREKTSVPKS